MWESNISVCSVDQLLHVLSQVWINQGDIILLGLRDYQDKKADVILKYNADEARNLKSYGEIPESGNLILAAIFIPNMSYVLDCFAVWVL